MDDSDGTDDSDGRVEMLSRDNRVRTVSIRYVPRPRAAYWVRGARVGPHARIARLGSAIHMRREALTRPSRVPPFEARVALRGACRLLAGIAGYRFQGRRLASRLEASGLASSSPSGLASRRDQRPPAAVSPPRRPWYPAGRERPRPQARLEAPSIRRDISGYLAFGRD